MSPARNRVPPRYLSMARKDVVHVVDDDPTVLRLLSLVLEQADLDVRCYASAEEFLQVIGPDTPGCIITDINMPGMSGIELHKHIVDLRLSNPVIILTGHGDVRMAVSALQRGAIDFIEKPFSARHLLERVRQALEQDAKKRAAEQRLKRLTPRQRQVMECLLRGQSSKEIAAELKLSHRTVDTYRAGVFDKLEVSSTVELVRAVLLGESEQPLTN